MFALILSLLLFTGQHQQPHVYSVAPNPITVQEDDGCIMEPTGGFWFIEGDDSIGFSSATCWDATHAAYSRYAPLLYPTTYYPLKYKKI